LGVAAIGVRGDFAAVSRDLTFLLHVALPVASGVAATIAAFLASVPGQKNRWSTFGIALLASWLLLVGIGALSGPGHVGAGVKCIRSMVALSVPPGLLLYFMLRRAAPLDRGTTGLLSALGVAALAHAGTRFLCHNDGALHVLAWHCAPLLLLGGVGILVGRALFR